MFSIYAISLALIALSGVLIDWHRRSWREVQQDPDLPQNQRRFALAQYRRRMQASGIIGLLGAAVGIGPLVPHQPWPMVLYMAAMAAACFAITLLAAIDAWATRQYYARLRSEQLAAQIKLSRELNSVRKSAEVDP